jgi:hypothetical protein
MQQKLSTAFALGLSLGSQSISRITRFTLIAACLSVCAGLPGCADSPNSAYPSLSKITDLGNILTPDEQKKAVQDLQKDENRSQTAAKDIQKQ